MGDGQLLAVLPPTTCGLREGYRSGGSAGEIQHVQPGKVRRDTDDRAVDLRKVALEDRDGRLCVGGLRGDVRRNRGRDTEQGVGEKLRFPRRDVGRGLRVDERLLRGLHRKSGRVLSASQVAVLLGKIERLDARLVHPLAQGRCAGREIVGSLAAVDLRLGQIGLRLLPGPRGRGDVEVLLLLGVALVDLLRLRLAQPQVRVAHPIVGRLELAGCACGVYHGGAVIPDLLVPGPLRGLGVAVAAFHDVHLRHHRIELQRELTSVNSVVFPELAKVCGGLARTLRGRGIQAHRRM